MFVEREATTLSPSTTPTKTGSYANTTVFWQKETSDKDLVPRYWTPKFLVYCYSMGHNLILRLLQGYVERLYNFFATTNAKICQKLNFYENFEHKPKKLNWLFSLVFDFIIQHSLPIMQLCIKIAEFQTIRPYFKEKVIDFHVCFDS